MKKIHLIKSKFSAVPADDEASELFAKLKQGSILAGETWKEREYFRHKAMFKLMQTVTRNNQRFNDPYGLLKILQLDVGSVDLHKKLNGEVVQSPKSIKFNKMDDNEFLELYKKIGDFMLLNIDILMPGMSKRQFESIVVEIAQMLN